MSEEQRNTYHDNNNIPDIIIRFKTLSEVSPLGEMSEGQRGRTDQSFLVPFSEIKENNWDLSINRYKEIVYEEVEYDAPADIITDIMRSWTNTTTNLNAKELEDRYGNRVRSRMRELFNLIAFDRVSSDKRK